MFCNCNNLIYQVLLHALSALVFSKETTVGMRAVEMGWKMRTRWTLFCFREGLGEQNCRKQETLVWAPSIRVGRKWNHINWRKRASHAFVLQYLKPWLLSQVFLLQLTHLPIIPQPICHLLILLLSFTSTFPSGFLCFTHQTEERS